MKKLFPIPSIIIFFIIVLNACSKEDISEEYSISTNVSPIEGGTILPAYGTFEDGQIVTITATPSENYEFINWTGDITGSKNPTLITVNSDKVVTAVFNKKDDDNDGVSNELDNCPDTQDGEVVDVNGCSASQLVGDRSLLFDKFWYTTSPYAYDNGKEIIYSNGKSEAYVNNELFSTADWVWEDESLGIIKLFNIQGPGQGWSTVWRKCYNIDEHSYKSQTTTNQIDYGIEIVWKDTEN